MAQTKPSENDRIARLEQLAADSQAKTQQIAIIVIMAIVGLLTLYFAGGWDGLFNSRP